LGDPLIICSRFAAVPALSMSTRHQLLRTTWSGSGHPLYFSAYLIIHPNHRCIYPLCF